MDDLDLYADVGDEFGHDDLDHSGAGADGGGDDDHGDLFDDVVASSSADTKDDARVKNEPGSPSGANSSASGQVPTRRYQLYVGNLTWWTTDQDIQDAVQELSISDFIEVKFFENRANGQSKGFCCVVLGSEASMRHVMDQLAKKEIHGQVPVVTWATKTALHQFESQSKTRPPQPSAQSGSGGGGGGPMRGPPMSSRGMSGGSGDRGRSQSMRGSSSGSTYSRPPPGRPPLMGAVSGLRGPPPALGLSAPPPGLPPPIIVGAPPPVLLSRGPPPGLPGTAPAPHVNPAFFPQGPPPGAGYAAPGVALGISEAEFDEIMSRNRTVSSSAIARAVQDAAAGEYASAIETLVTAISLIKQSKVAHDDRCRILVSSLQDTLHGIENKSYGASRSGGMRSRSRSRDRSHRGYREYGHSRTPDDRGHGHGHYRDERRDLHYDRRNEEERYRRDYRERSRSRERQDREKYYEERDHGKYFEERERRAKK